MTAVTFASAQILTCPARTTRVLERITLTYQPLRTGVLGGHGQSTKNHLFAHDVVFATVQEST